MKHYLLLILAVLGMQPPCLVAGGPSGPLRYVPADSVVGFAPGADNFLQTAMVVESDVRPRAIPVVEEGKRRLGRMRRTWDAQVTPRLGITGSTAAPRLPVREEEVYAAVDILDQAARLWQLTGEAGYMDAVERLAYNTLSAAVIGGGEAFARRVAARALAGATGVMAATGDDCIYLNLYANCLVRVDADSMCVSLDVQTLYPYSGRVKVRLGGMPQGRHRWTLKLRIPEWSWSERPVVGCYSMMGRAARLFTCYRNGHDMEQRVERGYWLVTADWGNGDEVYFDLPETPVWLRACGTDGRPVRDGVALQVGPLVYAAEPALPPGRYLATEAPLGLADAEGIDGQSLLQGKAYTFGPPADAETASFPQLFVPYREATEGAGLWSAEQSDQ